jgi:hypothetical protein
MPFNADSRCGLFKLELNISVIIGEVESMTDCTIYDWSKENEAKIYHYVLQIENLYANVIENNAFNTNFWEWFCDNYDNVETWNAVADILVENEYDDDNVIKQN